MPPLARTRSRDVALDGPGTLLQRCLDAGLPMASACSGRGACGKCVVSVISGADHLPPPDSHEQAVLDRNGALPDQRLACQCDPSDPLMGLVIATGYW